MSRRPSSILSLAILAPVLVLLAVGCPGQKPAATSSPAAPPDPAKKIGWRVSKSGLGFRLSDADEQEERRAAPAKTTALTADETKRLLGRLPPLQAGADDEKEFAFRERSLPPPRAGKTVQEPFPPKTDLAAPNQTKPGPLTVTRKLPAGAVDLAPHLSVSFSHPMVAITSHDDLAKAPPPVTLSPVPEGKWRWIGTQTVLFEPTPRFPMATEYTVEVPAGTKSATGLTLATAERWTFSTPPPKMLLHHPTSGSIKLEPIVFVSFDQAIDPPAMLKSIKMAAGVERLPIRLATEAEIEEDPVVGKLAQNAQEARGTGSVALKPRRPDEKRWLAFRAEGKLPTSTGVTITVEKGAPSAEGPKRTEKDQSFGFSTYGPFKVVRSSCGYDRNCPPMSPWSVELSNPIEGEAFKKELVTVTPELPGMKVTASGHWLTIQGRSKGRTKYKVALSSSITDVFSQTLSPGEPLTFDVGTAEPFLFSEEQEMSVLDPAGGPKLPVFSVNRGDLRVRLYAVKPEDWRAYLEWRRDWDYERTKALKEPPGKLVVNRVIKPRSAPDELVETPIDLVPALNREGFGQVVAVVEPTTPPREPWMKQWVRAWLQVTKMGLDAFMDDDQLFGWATTLESGAPVDGAEVSLWPGTLMSRTGKDGLARVGLLDAAAEIAVARKGGDTVMLPERWSHSANLRKTTQSDYLRWFVFDDRQMYKPGEEARVKGWIRTIGAGKGGDVAALPEAGSRTVNWQVRDSRGNEITKGKSSVDATGGFDLGFKLPGNANLGHAYVNLSVDSSVSGASHSHGFQIQEFRRPEFEVNASASEGPHLVGKHAVVTVAAKYYAGGGLGDAPVEWRVSRSDAHFTPPNRGDFVFGERSDWWWHSRKKKSKKGENTSETWTARTTPGGDHRLRVDFDALEPPYAMSLALEATVTDVNRQAWTARSTLLVHPADVYVGLRLERPFVKAGESLQVDSIVTDLDGKAVAKNKVFIRSARIDWEQVRGEYEERELDVEQCEIQSAEQATRCSLKTKEGGKYRITAKTTDAQGRATQTEMHVWVFGDTMKPDRDLKKDNVQVIADKEQYKAGDTAELLMVAPFAPAEGVLTLRRQGIVKIERFTLRSRTQTITVKVDDAHVPNLFARVDLVGAAERENEAGDPDPSLPKRPAYASGSAQLKIPPAQRTLEVAATPRAKKVEPGGSTVVDVDVKDAAGRAVAGSELAVVVVDESVLALSGYQLPDPKAAFYAARGDGARQMQIRDRVQLPKPDAAKLGLSGSGPGGGGGMRAFAEGAVMKSGMAPPRDAPAPVAAPTTALAKPKREMPMEEKKAGDGADKDSRANDNTPIAVRTDFNALAAFVPRVTTDARGHAEVPVKVPDSLTRYRVMAVAVAGEKQFGSGESTVTARLPLMLRPSAPRFLNFGDKFELPLVVQNQTDQPMTVDVAGRATNAQIDAVGRRVVVPPNDRVEVRLPAAAVKPGTARFQVGAAAGNWADAAQVEMPVWTPATTEAFATYGVIDQGAIAQPVKMPSNVVTQFGGLEITTSSTQLQALTDAVLYLVRYPYECNEQLSSRVIAIAALRDVLTAFKAAGLPPPEALINTVKKDVALLRTRQLYDGGWGFWHSAGGNPYITIHVAHALQRAKEKGFEVPPDMLTRAQGYLRSVESHIPSWWGPEARRALVAYSLYVRNRMGDADRARAKRLIAEAGGVEKLQMEPIGWILPVLSGDAGSQTELAAIRKHLANRVAETAGTAHFVTSYGDNAYLLLHSDRRADGVLLESIIGDQPQSDLIPKLVAGLLNHRKAGHWYNTQENAFVLLALDRYFNTYEKATPDFVARAWLGDKFAGERQFKGRSTDRYNVNIPMQLLAEVKQGDVVLQKDGVGRLYFRIGMQYAPSDLRPPPAEHGFTVSRVYEPVDDPGDVKRDADGVWRVKAGAKVRVRIGMVAQSRRYHVALVDPLPAGLEPMNPALAVTGSVPGDPQGQKEPYWWWKRTWYEHQNMRDERVEAFTSLLWDGVYDYTYVARATTPGSFVVPPPKAEEMYAPETFGRGAGDRVIVE